MNIISCTYNFNKSNYQKNNAKPAFKGMYLSDYVADLQILQKHGDVLKKRLPSHLLEKRTDTINQCIDYIKSKDFHLNVSKKNWIDEDETEWSMEYLKQDNFLKERADIILTKAFLRLEKLYKNHDEIIIPFSGGRDSTSLLATSLAFSRIKNIN